MDDQVGQCSAKYPVSCNNLGKISVNQIPALNGFRADLGGGISVESAINAEGYLVFQFIRPALDSDRTPRVTKGDQLAPGQSQFVMDGEHVTLLTLSLSAADAMVLVMNRVLAEELKGQNG